MSTTETTTETTEAPESSDADPLHRIDIQQATAKGSEVGIPVHVFCFLYLSRKVLEKYEESEEARACDLRARRGHLISIGARLLHSLAVNTRPLRCAGGQYTITEFD